ncbi:RsmE family RNA methyltransferase [Thermodesulfobacteriota bacterium]
MKNFRFFIRPDDLKDGSIILTGRLYHKIKNVLRYHKGDEITLLISNKKSFTGNISEISDDKIIVAISSEKSIASPTLFTTLYISLLKAKNFEDSIKKATELSVNRIVPVMTERSVVRLNDGDLQKKQQRWEKIISEAAAQTKRDDIPELADIVDISDLKHIDDDADLKIVCDENSKTHIKDILKNNDSVNSISAIIGPEGSLSKSEIKLVNSLGFRSVLLTNTILRAETVPIFLMSVLQYEFGELR